MMDTIREAAKTKYNSLFLENLKSGEVQTLIQRLPSRSFYIAARYGRKSEAKDIANWLRNLDHRVTSTWLDQSVDEMYNNDPEQSGWGARKDLQEIEDADILLYLSEKENNEWGRGGRHVEFGYALGLRKFCWIIGPLENIFHYLPYIVQFDSTNSFYDYMEGK